MTKKGDYGDSAFRQTGLIDSQIVKTVSPVQKMSFLTERQDCAEA